jgi:hypothetical protein
MVWKLMDNNQRKTKKVSGVDLSSMSFAFVGDEQDTSTWHCPLFVPGDAAKTRNLIGNALHRWSQTKGIPPAHRRSVVLQIIGAAKAHGLPVNKDVKVEVSDEEAALLLSEIAAHRFLEQIIGSE